MAAAREKQCPENGMSISLVGGDGRDRVTVVVLVLWCFVKKGKGEGEK